MADVTARMLALLSTLQTGRSFSSDELASRLGVSSRTLRRDVDRLRTYGYPVETQPGPGGYYRLTAGRTMPPLVLDDDEAVATLLALAALAAIGPSTIPTPPPSTAASPSTPASPAASASTTTSRSAPASPSALASASVPASTPATASRSASAPTSDPASAPASASAEGGIDAAALRAYGKLDQFLPARLRGRAMAVRSSLETSPQPAPSVPAEQLATIAEAITRSETISFAYVNARGEQTIRRVEPYRQIHYLLRWYLLGWDLDRDDWRVFRLDRITDERRTNTRYTPRPLPAESATAYLREGLNKAKQPMTLVIEAPAAAVIDALKYQDAEIHSLADDRTSVSLAIDSWQWLLLNLAFLDADFHFAHPTPFTPALQTFAARIITATTP